MSLKDLINASVRCALCGSKGVGTCNCWTKCATCGCYYERGTSCGRCHPSGRLVVAKPAKKRRKR